MRHKNLKQLENIIIFGSTTKGDGFGEKKEQAINNNRKRKLEKEILNLKKDNSFCEECGGSPCYSHCQLYI